MTACMGETVLISHRYFPDVATKDNFTRNAPRARSDQAFGSVTVAKIFVITALTSTLKKYFTCCI